MSDTRDPERDQVAPIPRSAEEVQPAHDKLIEMLTERKDFGFKKYQSYLQGGNGRNPLKDMIEELMDLSVYTVTALQEQDEVLPRWAKALVDAFIDDTQLDFNGCYVPAAVQIYLQKRAGGSRPDCCERMARELGRACNAHPRLEDCPDSLIVRHGDRTGIRIHDGSDSFSAIGHCPWCGAAL